MRTPRYGVSRVMGAETEYGVIAPAAPGTNPTILSAMVVNTYSKLVAAGRLRCGERLSPVRLKRSGPYGLRSLSPRSPMRWGER